MNGTITGRWGFVYDNRVVVSVRKSLLEMQPEIKERDYFGSPAATVRYLSGEAIESLVSDLGYEMVDIDSRACDDLTCPHPFCNGEGDDRHSRTMR